MTCFLTTRLKLNPFSEVMGTEAVVVDGEVVTMVTTEVEVVTLTEMVGMVTMATKGIMGITETEMVVTETQMLAIEIDQIDTNLTNTNLDSDAVTKTII